MKKLYIFLIAVFFSLAANAQIIVIDPGHGYGASTSDNPDGRTATEIETALEVGLRTKTLIQNSCVWTAQMTRTTNINGWISVNQRALMSNNWNADRLLSIHCNAGGGTGTETFYCTDSDTNTAPDIAFAQKIQADMVTNGSWNNRRCVEDNSFLAYHLGVLKYSSATGCLNEIGFVDSADATKLTSTTWRDQFALSYFNSLKSDLNLSCSTTPPGLFTLTATPECNAGATQVKLTWTVSANATSYDIYRNGVVYASSITGTQYTNTAVASGTFYTYSVKAKNSGTTQTVNSNGTLSVTAINCASPGAFTLTVTPECNSAAASQIKLTWTSSANTTSYDIYRNGTLYASDITGTQFLNTYLITGGTIYTYSVKAKNNISQVTNSNGTLSTTAISCPPGAFTLTATPDCASTTSRINLTWTASANATSYDIYRNGNLYASDVTETQFLNTYLITAGSTYTYYIKAKNSNGSVNNSNGTQTAVAINCAAKIAEENTSAEINHTEISLYPNPTDGIVNVIVHDIKSKQVSLTLFDSNGKIILEKTIIPSLSDIANSIDISTMPKGMYIVRITSDNQEYSRKIIKE